jgi:uncharacterized membrane protein affecting hemolysin expression
MLTFFVALLPSLYLSQPILIFMLLFLQYRATRNKQNCWRSLNYKEMKEEEKEIKKNFVSRKATIGKMGC